MPLPILPTVAAFPKDDQVWRLDWLGDVLFRRHVRERAPFIRLSLSPWPGVFPYTPQEQRHVEVPIGILPILTVGTLWKAGQRVEAPAYDEATFEVHSSEDKTRFIKAGVDNPDGAFFIPFDRHPYHKGHTHSWCLLAEAGGGASLLIPAFEIIRFYFGSSSGLITRLFSGPFDTARLWERTGNDTGPGNVHVDLARGLSGASAADIARIVFDAQALHCAKLIASSVLASTDEKHYPKAHLPFAGESVLRVKGMWLDEIDKKSFLAFQILSCSHPFPFETLTYTMTRRQPGQVQAQDDADRKPSKGPVPLSPVAAAVSLESGPPAAGRQPRHALFQTSVRFPDLLRKKVLRGDPENPITVLVGGIAERSGSPPPDEGRSGLPAIDLVIVEEILPLPKNYPRKNPVFGEALRKFVAGLLGAGNGVSFVPLDSRQRFPQVSEMPNVVDGNGELHPLSYIDEGDRVRPRYLSIIVAVRNAATMAYAVIEPDPTRDGTAELIVIEGVPEVGMDARWVAATIIKSRRSPAENL